MVSTEHCYINTLGEFSLSGAKDATLERVLLISIFRPRGPRRGSRAPAVPTAVDIHSLEKGDLTLK